MSLSRRVGWNTAGQLAGRLYSSSLAFVITALVLPYQLSEHDFGIFAFYLALYHLLTNVLDFGSGTIVVREASRRRERAGELIGLLIRIKGLFAAAGVVLLVAVAWAHEGTGARLWILALAALHLLFHAPAGAGAIFQVDMTFKWSVLSTVVGQSAWLAATLGLALGGVDRPELYLAAFGLGPVVTGCLAYGIASRRVAIRYDAGREALRRLWSESWPAGVSMTMAAVYFNIDTAMLRPLASEEDVAHYSAAYRLMTFALMVPVVFSQVVFPVFSRLWERGVPSLLPAFRRSLDVLLVLGLLIAATAPLVRREVLLVVYPDEYVVGGDALAVLCLAVAAVFATYPHIMVLLAAGHQRVMMVVSLAAAVLNIAANLWAIPRFGIVGAAWTTLATEGFVCASTAVLCARLTGVHAAARELVRPVLCAVVASGLLAALLAVLPEDAAGARLASGVLVAAIAIVAARIFPLDLDTEEGAPTHLSGTAEADG